MGKQTELKDCQNCNDTFIGVDHVLYCIACQVALNLGNTRVFNNRKNKHKPTLDMGRRHRNKNNNARDTLSVVPKYRVFIAGGDTNYVRWIPNCVVTTNFDRANLILFTGGSDVNPELYGEAEGSKTSVNKSRDSSELRLFNESVKAGKKMLGICRGAQFLCAMAGGRVIQHCDNHAISGMHECIDINDDKFDMTSTHHQMMYPFELNEDDYTMIAYSSNKLSTIYLNGEDEQIELPKDFVEPEVVMFNNIQALAIQGHPERMREHTPGIRHCVNYLTNFMSINFKKKDQEVKI